MIDEVSCDIPTLNARWRSSDWVKVKVANVENESEGWGVEQRSQLTVTPVRSGAEALPKNVQVRVVLTFCP
jgi:hypothetical protein